VADNGRHWTAIQAKLGQLWLTISHSLGLEAVALHHPEKKYKAVGGFIYLCCAKRIDAAGSTDERLRS